VYHEHLSYISLGAMERLCGEHGMALVDVEQIDLHGGSILLHMRRRDRAGRPSERLARLLERESRAGMHDPGRLKDFAAEVGVWKSRFEDLVGDLVGRGATLVGYGAAAKANTLLNFCPDAAKAISHILDRSGHKQGRYTPGTHIRVENPDTWTNPEHATHMVVLAWNFKDEIMRQMKPFADRGGRFVIPIPEPQVI
jgi:hypothetical protein